MRDIYLQFAQALTVDPAVVEAIAAVETGGKGGFLPDGRPRILYEPHVFSRNTRGRFNDSHPHISFPSWRSDYRYGALTAQWDKFDEATKLDRDAAIMACSWGVPQILGENWKACGFGSPEAFYWAFHSRRGQVAGTLAFAGGNRALVAAARTRGWHAIARIYNGPAYAKHGYHDRLKAAYEAAKGNYTREEWGE